MTLHMPFVVRGADGHGPAGLSCNACHHAANYAESGVPGHPKWHLAPASMAWAGKPLGEICRQIAGALIFFRTASLRLAHDS